MDADQSSPSGLLNSLHALGDSLLAGVQDRIELISIEIQEEKLRLIQISIYIGALAIMGVMSLTFISLTVVYLFWDGARLAVLGGLAFLYSGALLAIALTFRRFLARHPSPFSGIGQVISDDRSCIRKES